MSLPRFNLIYYKAVLDKCFIRFFNDYNDIFSKIDDKYILSKDLSQHKLALVFKQYLIEELLQLIKPYSLSEPNFYFVIGACMPKDNLLLKYKDSYFPEKLLNAIDGTYLIKYLLKEKDIKIDLVKFNECLINLFDYFFKSTRNVLRAFGREYNNILFIKHKNLDCYSMFKTIKYIYGKRNCWNLQKEKLYDVKSPIVAINDCIDKYILNKVAMNKSEEFKTIVQEVLQFIEEKLKEMRSYG